jgi:putative transposase
MVLMVGRQLRLFRASKPRRRGRPTKEGAGVRHRARPALASRFPVHVTVRVREDVRNLRTRVCFRALAGAFRAGRERFGFRMVGYSVQGNHIHFLVEGGDAQALSRGMQGLTIRMAKALNRTLGRSGKVFADRYHSHILRTPTEVARARNYVLRNHARHHEQHRGWALPSSYVDAYAAICVEITAAPHTWLLREGWRRTKPRTQRRPQ